MRAGEWLLGAGLLTGHRRADLVGSHRQFAEPHAGRSIAVGGGDDDLRKKLLEFDKFAAKFFRSTLQHPEQGKRGRDYIATRALKPETVEQFGLGYVREDWRSLLDAATRAGFNETVVEKSGLARRGEKGHLYDLFRNLVFFSICYIAENIVLFGGRFFVDLPAKYINSSDNPFY